MARPHPVEPRRVGDADVRERASLAMPDTIGFAEERGMMWDGEAVRRRASVRDGFGDSDRRCLLSTGLHHDLHSYTVCT